MKSWIKGLIFGAIAGGILYIILSAILSQFDSSNFIKPMLLRIVIGAVVASIALPVVEKFWGKKIF